MTNRPGGTAGRALKWTGLIVLGWTVPAIIGASGHFAGMSMMGNGMPGSHVIGHSLAIWYAWVPVTPLILLAWRRLPHTGAGLAAALPVHAVLVTTVFLLQAVFATAVGHRTGHVPPNVGVAEAIRGSVAEQAAYDLLIYVGLLAAVAGVDLARRYRERDLRASQLEAQLAQARLSALQMQLQPHFLFNALNSVAMLVRRQQTREALDVIVGFGELLRYVLDEAGTTDVPLRDELRFVRQYLEIERVRYGDRLTIVLDAPEELGSAVVPNLVLQPLVENAIKHGIATRAAGGTVAVTAACRGDTLVLTVRNDGPPLPHGWTVEEADGVGLRNVRERLAASVGGDARFTIGNAGDGTGAAPATGVEATVTLPYRVATRGPRVPAPAPAFEARTG
ncbi:MAG TPA: sensor histidine kinase [Gemmatimonadaceae bacterium]|nr:sensor histidine kinase [Gemmatimonadaceae bacterium]